MRMLLSLFSADARRLPTRLLIAGSLLAIALPALGGLAAALGYPAMSPSAPGVVVLAGLQLLIVLYAATVAIQLAAAAAGAVSSAVEKKRWRDAAGAAGHDVAATGRRTLGSTRHDLRALTDALVDLIWEQEQRGRGSLKRAILGVVHDAVSAEIEHRRQERELARRYGELERM